MTWRIGFDGNKSGTFYLDNLKIRKLDTSAPTYNVLDSGFIMKDEAKAGYYYALKVSSIADNDGITLTTAQKDYTINNIPMVDGADINLKYLVIGNYSTVPGIKAVSSGNTVYNIGYQADAQ